MKQLTDLLSSQIISQVTKGVKGNETQVNSAMKTALPMLMGALKKNTTKPMGAAAFTNAMSKHNGSIFDSIDVLAKDPDKGEGPGILKHVLGSNLSNATKTISSQSGLDGVDAQKILKIAAPLVMGALGKNAKNINANNVVGFLQDNATDLTKRGGLSKVALSLLDTDGDGQIQDDLLNKGIALVKNLFFK